MGKKTALQMSRFASRFMVLLLSFTLLTGCIFASSNPEKPENSGEPDRLGSWSQISQEIKRGEDWRQIVFNSPFQLGKKSVKGTWNTSSGKQDYYSIEFGTYPRIDGSTVAVPMAVEFARQHLGFSDEDANSFVAFSTTDVAYENLIRKTSDAMGMLRSENTFTDENHPVDLIIVTAPSDDELALAKKEGVTLVMKPVCYDAFVFITHKDNPVDSLTLDEVRGIYSGRITNWKEVGGEDKPIIAYQREENSGSQTGMINLVMGELPLLPPETVRIIQGMGMLVDTVAEYRNGSASIGYTYRYYIDNLYKNEDIKILRIDGISSDAENLQSNAYPLTVSYYGIIRGGEESSPGGLFLDWMLSKEGQQCIGQAGYIPYYKH